MRFSRLTFSQMLAAFALFSVSSVDAVASSTDDTYIKASQIACDSRLDPNSQSCYEQVLLSLEKLGGHTFSPDSNAHSKLMEYGTSLNYNGYSTYSMRGKKTKQVLVTIHGLWGNGDQFAGTIGKSSAGLIFPEVNVISLTLPGHLKTGSLGDDYLREVKDNPPFASFDKWLLALDETMKVAKMMGNEVTVIGQSTGGLLAVIAAYRYPDEVKNVLLVEPALKVKALLNFGSCTLGNAITKSPFVHSIAKLIRGSVPDGANVKMGCEVQRLANSLLTPLAEANSKGAARYVSAIQNLARNIKQPVYLVNNERDGVVNADINKVFFAALPGLKRYDSINLDGKLPHGYVTTMESASLALALLEINYLTDPTDQGAFYDYASVIQGLLGFAIRNPYSYDGSASYVKSLQLDRRVCQFVSGEDCRKAKDAIAQLVIVHSRNESSPALINEIKQNLKPTCDRLDLISAPPWDSPAFRPACK